MTAMLVTEATKLSPEVIADLAVAALRAEAELTPKPGLVDQRGGGAHTDMDIGMLLTSADALRDGFVACARAAQQLPLGVELRARVGIIGRTTEHHMLAVTGGVNTHRGALWSLGLLAAGVARHEHIQRAVQFAAALALHPDPALRRRPVTHTATARADATARQARPVKPAPATPMSSATRCQPFGAHGLVARTKRPRAWTRYSR